MHLIQTISNFFSPSRKMPSEEEVQEGLKKYNLEIGDKVIINNMKAQVLSFENGQVVIINRRDEIYPVDPLTVVNCAIKNLPSCINN